jgi:hypothetical protein
MDVVERTLKGFRDRKRRIMEGGVNCIPSPFPNFRNDFPGVEQGKYYLISGAAKASKTQLSSLLFLYTPLLYAYEHPDQVHLKIFYFPLEETDEKITARFCSHLLHKLSEHKLRYSPMVLNSINENKVAPDEVLDLLDSLEYQSILNFYKDHVEFKKDKNPTGCMKTVVKYAEENGTFHKKWDERLQKMVFDYYEPNDPTEYRIIVLDHIGIIDLERGMNKKEAIDKTSEYLAKYLRNRYGFTSIVIQQQNTSGESNDSVKLGRIRPSGAGLADSTYTQKDQNVLFGLFNPYKYSLPEYMGYDIRRLKDHIRFLEVVVNRDGELGGICPLFFDGATCSFFEMPLPDNKAELEKVYKYAESLDKPKKVETTLFSWFKKLNIFKVKTS